MIAIRERALRKDFPSGLRPAVHVMVILRGANKPSVKTRTAQSGAAGHKNILIRAVDGPATANSRQLEAQSTRAVGLVTARESVVMMCAGAAGHRQSPVEGHLPSVDGMMGPKRLPVHPLGYDNGLVSLTVFQ